MMNFNCLTAFISDIEDCINKILKKNEKLTTNHPIQIHINRINNRLAFKMKNRYKLELQISETMKLLDNTKKLIVNKKYGKKCTKP